MSEPHGALSRECPPDAADQRDARMRTAVEDLWHARGSTSPSPSRPDISWVGFYLKVPQRDELVLGPRRDKPACSPIGLHGACGRSFLSRRPLVVRDAAALGAAYIACDPRDRSEAVVPLIDGHGVCWGVLDADSHAPNAFSIADAQRFAELLAAAGLTCPDKFAGPPEVV